jgi:CRP/FNR family transcriptional regulator, cyclic AMP receptor protein
MDEQLFQRFGKTFPRGTVLFREGDPGRQMFVVQSGRVAISKRAGEVEKILTTLGAGEFFGEMSILNNKPRSATATCVDDARLLVVDAKTFETMIRSNAEVAVRMIQKLAARLEESNGLIENLLFSDASSRVVHHLALAADRGERTPAGQRIALRIQDVAAQVGVKPEAAQEVLAKLVKAGIVVAEPAAVVVPDVTKLRHFLEFLQMKAQFGDLA